MAGAVTRQGAGLRIAVVMAFAALVTSVVGCVHCGDGGGFSARPVYAPPVASAVADTAGARVAVQAYVDSMQAHGQVLADGATDWFVRRIDGPFTEGSIIPGFPTARFWMVSYTCDTRDICWGRISVDERGGLWNVLFPSPPNCR